MADPRLQVQSALKALATAPSKKGAIDLFSTLGYASRKTVDLDGTPEAFLNLVDPGHVIVERAAARISEWRHVYLLFQLTNDELPILAQGNRDLLSGQSNYRTSIIESFVFLAIELAGDEWTRGGLARITREVNRLFPMPAVILFRHGALASLAVIDRRPNKKDGSRDVLERISIVKDIKLAAPHRAHVDILCDIALSAVKVRDRGTPTNFRDLYDGWIEALSAQALNKRFYRELANWFFWSVNEVMFPAAAIEIDEKKRAEQNQIAVIRLLTRLIFVWFIKEKGLVPEALFERDKLAMLLNENPANQRDSSTFYKAVLQNLFFATLNTEMNEERKWRTKATTGGLDGQYLIHTVYRYRNAFRDPDAALNLFKEVPFLNGGLFECLDREIPAGDIERNPSLKSQIIKEGNREVIRIDGFSERPENPLKVPNKIFFSEEENIRPTDEYDPLNGKPFKAIGLIELFSRYKFTIEENTPVEEEVALDPELLGKVFENLLASYNPDTKMTARKKSGSFYTPREVVEYMVDEALIAYFSRAFPQAQSEQRGRRPKQQMLEMAMPGEFDLTRQPQLAAQGTKGLAPEQDARLRDLLASAKAGNPFPEHETEVLIAAIDNLRALDPACGSGAFPMGLLQKLIHVLHRLDPDNARWKAQNRGPLEQSLAAAHATVSPSDREKRIEEAEIALAKLDRDFSDANKPDYARKLYLIDKCLFGVDIQPIAVQIAKLRFFISLVVSQKIDPAQDNLNITALPNLETKLVAANSLIPIERPFQADLFRNTKIGDKEAELRGMNARYFSARTIKTKRARREDIARLRDELARLLKLDRGLPEADAVKMAAWDPFDQNAAAPFFDPEWMFGLSSGFDLVIGNPPYVRQEAIKDQKRLLERHFGGRDKKGNPVGSYAGTADLFVYFIQRGVELLNPGGAFAFITSNKWYRAKYGTNLRGWINRQTELRRILDFGDAEVFDAIAYPTIIIATRREAPVPAPGENDSLRVMNWPQDREKSEVDGFSALVDEIGFDMPQKELLSVGWQLAPLAKRDLLERVRLAGMPLGKFVDGRFLYGVKTGFNDAFIINGADRERLISDHMSSAEIIKPFIRGRDIKRWRVEPQDLWLIKLESSENTNHPWSGFPLPEAEKIFAKSYPAIQRFMSRYRDELSKRTDQGTFYWELRSCAYWPLFEVPKLIYPDIALGCRFAWDIQGSFSGDTTFFLPNPPHWLSSLLNSTVVEWYYSQISPRIQNGFLRFKTQYLETIPVPKAIKGREHFLDSVAKILEQGQSESIRIEQLLNGFVYELFFANDLHTRGLALFEEAERSGFGQLADLEGVALVHGANSFAAAHLGPGARLRTMLADLSSLDVVRIIEGRE